MPTRASLGFFAACALAALLSACPSTGVYRTADPVEPKKWRLGAGSGIGVLRDTERDSSTPTFPLALTARYGLVEDLDIGGRLYSSGAGVDATWRVYRSTWSFALAPSLGGVRLLDSPATVDSINLFANLQGIASRPLSKRWKIAMGPSTGWGLYYPETGGNAQGLWVGAFVGAEVKLGSRWRVGPEISGFNVVSGQVPVDGRYFQIAGFATLDL